GQPRGATSHGPGGWGTASDIRKAGLLKAEGVLLGCFVREYLRHDGPEHVLCFAPTRSGKGVGLVIPTLLTWPGSAIIHDIKGENWTGEECRDYKAHTLAASGRCKIGRAHV